MNVGDEHMTLSSASSHSTKPQLSAAAANNDNQKNLFVELQHLKTERQQLLSKLKGLGGLQELNHDLIITGGDKHDLNEALPEQANLSLELSMKILEMDQTIQLLGQRISAIENKSASYGRTTKHRINRLEELLKNYGGSQAFKQLQSDLGLSPSQFTRLVKCLDKRCFEIQRCPGAQRGGENAGTQVMR